MHLLFVILCYFIRIKMIPCKMNCNKYQCPIVILVYLLCFLIFWKQENKRNASNNDELWVKLINEMDNKNLILNGKKITYSIFFQFCLPKVWPIPFLSDLIRIPKLRRLRWYVNDWIYVNTTAKEIVLWIPYPDKNLSQEYWLISNDKPTSLTIFGCFL